MTAMRDIATGLSGEIAKLGPFELVSDGSAIPVFAFKLKDDVDTYSVFDVSDKLREYGWQVPAYTMPEHAEDVAVLRIVVREGFSRDMADMLLDDIHKAVAHFEGIPEHKPKESAPQFKH
jgi:glutamate decarboxylase